MEQTGNSKDRRDVTRLSEQAILALQTVFMKCMVEEKNLHSSLSELLFFMNKETFLVEIANPPKTIVMNTGLAEDDDGEEESEE